MVQIWVSTVPPKKHRGYDRMTPNLTVDSLIESPAPKKQTIDSDSLNLSYSICGGIPPPLTPT